jgi:hypothetical protein
MRTKRSVKRPWGAITAMSKTLGVSIPRVCDVVHGRWANNQSEIANRVLRLDRMVIAVHKRWPKLTATQVIEYLEQRGLLKQVCQ